MKDAREALFDISTKLSALQEELVGHLDSKIVLKNKVRERAFQGVQIIVIELLTRKIVLVTEAWARLFGYYIEDLEGQLVDIIIPLRFRLQHTKMLEEYRRDPKTRRMGVGKEIYGLRKDKTEFSLDIGLEPFTIDNIAYARGIGLEK